MFAAEVRRRAADDGSFLLPAAHSVKRPERRGRRGTLPKPPSPPEFLRGRHSAGSKRRSDQRNRNGVDRHM